MLTILHGDDTASSRQAYLSLKKEDADVVTFFAENVNITDLKQVLEGGGLFQNPKKIFIEDLITKRKKSDELDSILALLIKEKEHTIVLWEGKELTPSQLNKCMAAKIQKFSFPQTLFQFLDSIIPGKTDRGIRLLQQTLQTTPVEMVLSMLSRHVRLLLALFETPHAQIEETKRLSPWQKSKLEKQARLFTREQLLSFHEALYRIDLEMKTGASSIPLSTRIDFLLSSL